MHTGWTRKFVFVQTYKQFYKGHTLAEKAGASHPFISHFRLKQLDLRNDQVHVDRLAAVL